MIKLTSEGGKNIWINPSSIFSVEELEVGTGRYSGSEDKGICVQESAEEVVKKLLTTSF